MNLVIFGNTVWRICIAIAVFVTLFFVVKFLLKHLSEFVEKVWETKERKLFTLFESIAKLPTRFWILLELFIASKILILPEKAQYITHIIILLILLFWVAKIIIKITTVFTDKLLRGNPAWKKTIEMIVNVLVRVLWILIFLTNIWVNLTPLVASLWVASIAVAFALQNILSDLFSSFSILFAKPFVIWDFIEVWSFSGTVKSITLKSTILTNISWQEVVIPNSSILANSIVNYWKSKYRWQRLTLTVTYSTSINHLKEIPEIIKKVVTKVKDAEFEWCYFQKMNDYSLDFLCSYKSLSPDYQKMLEVNEQIYLWILWEFEKKWIELAFPTQTVYHYNLDDCKAKEKSQD